jgi:hypothetical protein
MHLVDFIIRIYHDARSSEYQIIRYVTLSILLEFHWYFVVYYCHIFGMKWRPYVSLKVSVRLDISLRIEHGEGLKCHKMSIRLNSKSEYSETHSPNKHVLNSVIIIRDFAADVTMP